MGFWDIVFDIYYCNPCTKKRVTEQLTDDDPYAVTTPAPVPGALRT